MVASRARELMGLEKPVKQVGLEKPVGLNSIWGLGINFIYNPPLQEILDESDVQEDQMLQEELQPELTLVMTWPNYY